MEKTGIELLADYVFLSKYSQKKEDGLLETWNETIDRIYSMHRIKLESLGLMNFEIKEIIEKAKELEYQKIILSSQRGRQFASDRYNSGILKHEAKLYNCCSTYIDKVKVFSEIMYLLLCGCGVGYSLHKKYIEKLPIVKPLTGEKSSYLVIEDSIEGWADAFGVLLSSYFVGGGTFPEYEGCQVHFDFSKIRPKGSLISGGFKAPGPDGLREALVKCEALLEDLLKDSKEAISLKPITAYDFVMHMSDAVLSGGVRRSATICLFSKTDKEMLNAKTGDWYITNPQRGRSNNSVMLIRSEVTREEWAEIMKSVKQVGEPGFIFTDNLDFHYNPCVTI